MTMTLWRNDELLGELIARPVKGDAQADSERGSHSLSAFLLPAPGVLLEGTMQTTLPPEFRFGVQQRPVAPLTLGEPTRNAGRASTGPRELRHASPEAIAGVPASLQLTVRTGDAAGVLPEQVVVQEVRVPASAPAHVLDEIPPGALVDGRTWTAFIVFPPE